MLDLIERVPPQSLDAEASVLGAILLDRDAVLVAIAKKLRPDHFYKTAHRVVYAAMLRLVEAGAPVDVTTLADDLAARHELEPLGGRGYLRDLIDVVPSAAAVDYYAGMVRSKASLRALAQVGARIAKEAYDAAEPADVVAERAQAALMEVLAERLDEKPATVKDAVLAELARLDRPPEAFGASTGLRALDEIIGGLRPRRLYVLAGMTGRGKTSCAVGIARHVALSGLRVLYVTLEMGQDEIVRSWLAQGASVDLKALTLNRLGPIARAAVTREAGVLHAAPLEIDDSAGMTISRVRARARLTKLRNGLGLVVVDYLQLCEGERRGGDESRATEVATVSRGLKQLARELDVPVIALSQLNRAVDARDGHRPRLSDLRESGAVEQDADCVIFVHHAPDSVGAAELIVAKQRAGPTGSARVKFTPSFVRFEDEPRCALAEEDYRS